MVAKLKKAGEAGRGTSPKKAKSVTNESGGKAARKVGGPKKTSSKNASAKSRSASPKRSAKAAGKKASDKPGTKSTRSGIAKNKVAAGKTSTKSNLTKKKIAAVKRPAPPTSRKRTSSKTISAKNGDAQAIDDFKSLVNLTRSRLESWLDTDESKKVDLKDRKKGEPAGYEYGKRIVELIGKRRDRYSEDDLKHIHKVVDYIKRHAAQRPKGDITASNWRYSLMNWGHDPAK
jgi:hypothetical protein